MFCTPCCSPCAQRSSGTLSTSVTGTSWGWPVTMRTTCLPTTTSTPWGEWGWALPGGAGCAAWPKVLLLLLPRPGLWPSACPGVCEAWRAAIVAFSHGLKCPLSQLSNSRNAKARGQAVGKKNYYILLYLLYYIIILVIILQYILYYFN